MLKKQFHAVRVINITITISLKTEPSKSDTKKIYIYKVMYGITTAYTVNLNHWTFEKVTNIFLFSLCQVPMHQNINIKK